MPDTTFSQVEPYAAAVRKLLKGVVYHDDPAWFQIRDYELPLREYFAKIGLGVHLDEIWSFAYLYDMSRDDDQQNALPPLTTRRRLSFLDTLLLVLLRERLDEHEMRDLDGASLRLPMDELKEMIVIFASDHPDMRQMEQTIETSIKRLVGYGFLKQSRDGSFEVRPLLRARISADDLEDIKARLAGSIHQNDDTGDDDGESV